MLQGLLSTGLFVVVTSAHSCPLLKIVWLNNCPPLKNSWIRQLMLIQCSVKNSTLKNDMYFGVLASDMLRRLLSLRRQPPLKNRLKYAKKSSTLPRFIIYLIFLCHFIHRTTGKVITYPFENILCFC